MKVRGANLDDCELVGTLVFELITELSGPKLPTVTKGQVQQTTRGLMNESVIQAFLAETADGEAAGVLTLNACAAIYAGGHFGEITELYVRPTVRSTGIGARLLDAAIAFARAQRWTRLEVCTPPAPPWERSVEFYQQNGFLLLGRRLKLPIE